MGLKDNLPEFVTQEQYINEILEAIQPEIDEIKLKLSKILLECCISTCTEDGLARFEEDYSLKYSTDMTIEKRKRQVISKMLASRRLTKNGLANFIKLAIDNGQYYISNMAENYSFKVMITNSNLQSELYNALYRARPAHLTFEVCIVSYEKRCGTFSCNNYLV